MEIEDEFNQIHPDDLWVYNKLQLSRKLGYICGPAGMKVPKSGFYIVRPSINFLGMGINSRIISLDSSTDHLNPGEFWCELFVGEHLSVDFHNENNVLTVKGHRNSKNPLSKWNCWTKINRKIEFPLILRDLKKKYEWINCEMIGNNIIEVHFRQNPDFQYHNSIAIPVWRDKMLKIYKNMRYVESKDQERLGFWVK